MTKITAISATVNNIVWGTIGNTFATTSSLTDVLNVFDAVTLGTTQAGVDCTAANAVTDILASFNTNSIYAVTGASGGGTSVVFTCNTAGTQDGSVGNSLASTETFANASFGTSTFTGTSL